MPRPPLQVHDDRRGRLVTPDALWCTQLAARWSTRDLMSTSAAGRLIVQLMLAGF